MSPPKHSNATVWTPLHLFFLRCNCFTSELGSKSSGLRHFQPPYFRATECEGKENKKKKPQRRPC